MGGYVASDEDGPETKVGMVELLMEILQDCSSEGTIELADVGGLNAMRNDDISIRFESGKRLTVKVVED